MSSGRRPSGSSSPTAWRSLSISKKRAPTSLSLVFAEPEQGAPLESAAAKLPPAVYNNDIVMRKRERLESTSTLQDDSKDSASISGESVKRLRVDTTTTTTTSDDIQSESATDATKSAPDVLPTPQREGLVTEAIPQSVPSDPAPETLHVPFPSTQCTKSNISPKPSAGGSSWFGSLSRVKGKDKAPKIISLDEDVKVEGRTLPAAAAAANSSPPEEPAPTSAPAAPEPQPEPPTQPSQPQQIPAAPRQPNRGWFSSTPSPSPSVPTPTPTPIPSRPPLSPTTSTSPNSHSHSTSLASIPSSIDDEVPKLAVLTPPNTPNTPNPASMMQQQSGSGASGSGPGAGGSTAKLSSLNPSSSRFTLSIPLLGRPKMPLDRAVAAVTAATEDGRKGLGSGRGGGGGEGPVMLVVGTEATSEPATTTTTTTSTITTQMDKVSQTTTTTPNGLPPPPESPAADQQPSSKTAPGAGDPSLTSWWGYVGWNKSTNPPDSGPPSTSTSTSTAREHAPTSPSSDGAATIRAVKSDLQLPVSASSSPVPPQSQAPPSPVALATGPARLKVQEGSKPAGAGDVPSVPGAGLEQGKDKDKPPSVFSASTAQTQSSATWYVPWKWYDGSAGAGKEGKEGKGNLTLSEMVKEEALARDRGAAAAPAAGEAIPMSTPTPTIEITSPGPAKGLQYQQEQQQLNPIESMISSNRSGWASFFSSRSLVVKEITDGKTKDENGMEVMDIGDDDVDANANTDGGRAASVDAKAPSRGPANENKAKEQTKPPPEVQPRAKPKQPPPPSEPKPKPLKPEKPKDVKSKPAALPLTNSQPAKRDTANKAPPLVSAAASTKSGTKSPITPRIPNLVLPTWADTFHTEPRSLVPSTPSSAIAKTFNYVSGVLFQWEKDAGKKMGKGKARDKEFADFGQELPRAFDVLGEKLEPDVLRGCSKAVIIGVHGWFPGAVMRTVLGDPTGTSGKFVDMMLQALDDFQEKHGVKLKKITKIPLEGEGTINKRVDKLYKSLLANTTWMNEIHAADVIFVATHSQGSIVSTHLLDRLIRDGHIRTFRSMEAVGPTEPLASGSADIVPTVKPQRVCCLAVCGIHLGPLRYLSTSSLLQPYFQYFESAAARELFEFQDTESEVSKQYAAALKNVAHHGTKMVYVASLNDQVVPMYSGLFITASHPLILRALYIDGDAYQSSDFLSNLLVLLLRVLNSGISDSGLLTHLSEATAGSLNGVGHSTAYEELATYSLAVDYCFLANDGSEVHPELVVDSFDAKNEQNDYEIPWALRDVIADERVAHFFSNEIVELRDAFREWHPKTTILRDIKKKLQPIQRLPSSILRGSSGSASKL